jgi:hypothetical protein
MVRNARFKSTFLKSHLSFYEFQQISKLWYLCSKIGLISRYLEVIGGVHGAYFNY